MESTKEPAIRVKGARKFQGSTASRKMKPNAATQQNVRQRSYHVKELCFSYSQKNWKSESILFEAKQAAPDKEAWWDDLPVSSSSQNSIGSIQNAERAKTMILVIFNCVCRVL